MKKQLSDEQLDTLMRNLLNDAAADDATVNEIADSPAIWWGVQRRINSRRATMLSAWPPIGKVLRWLMIGVPVAAATAFIISFIVFRPAETGDNIAKSISQPITTVSDSKPSILPIDNPSIDNPPIGNTLPDATKAVQNLTRREKPQVVTAKFRHDVKHSAVRQEVTTAANVKKSAEIKTEFIALSYARNPESGQIVRVRVPSSMMVSLGLVASVKKPSEMVDAEVLVGDDGLTRAIRFIH